MRTALALALLGMLVVTGCDLDFIVPSLHPFHTDGDTVFEPALVEPWER
jgi:hypothetical protein